jgi:endonuclease III-like uncharacterized protein
MTAGQKKNIERLKKLQADAKKLKKANPKLSHIDAIRIAAGKKIGAVKHTAKSKNVAPTTKRKKPAKKITERVVLTQAHKVKNAANKLDELQHEHMLQKSIGSLSAKYIAVYTNPKGIQTQLFKTTSLMEAKKLATGFKKLHNIKGTLKVQKFSHL